MRLGALGCVRVRKSKLGCVRVHILTIVVVVYRRYTYAVIAMRRSHQEQWSPSKTNPSTQSASSAMDVMEN